MYISTECLNHELHYKLFAVLDLIKSKKTIKPGHLQLLSEHLGREWKEVGNFIGLTTGETDMIEDKYKTCDEVSHSYCIHFWKQAKKERNIFSQQ